MLFLSRASLIFGQLLLIVFLADAGAVAAPRNVSTDIHNAAVETCLRAKEKLPQIPSIRRTPNTIGDFAGVDIEKVTDSELVLT